MREGGPVFSRPSAEYDVEHVDDVKINLIDCEQTIEVVEGAVVVVVGGGHDTAAVRSDQSQQLNSIPTTHNQASRGTGSPFIRLPVY